MMARTYTYRDSHIYVIHFDSGTLKVGRAADVVARLRVHRRQASQHGVSVTAEWYSAPCGEIKAAHLEQKLIDFCARHGTLRAGQEYFCGLNFEEVRALAEKLAGAPEPPAAKPPPAKSFPAKK
ncbi:GIY-YIG nuclease family protein [Nonomuraea wenchangensis]